MNPPPTVPVWDGAVRVLHWTLVLAMAVATLSLWWLDALHQPAGYVALAAVTVRLLWGTVLAPRASYARFTQFVRAPRATWAYLRLLLHRREPRCIGHNPLGGWMVLTLMACVLGLALTGWLYTSDWLWGDERVEQVHRALAWVLCGLVPAHLAGVAYTSLRHHENLVRAMFTGRKRGPEDGDVA